MTSLKGIANVGDSTLSDQLEANLLAYFSWGMLVAGGYSNVTLAAPGPFGGDRSRLRLVDDPNYESGQVWEGFRKDWVWETGVPVPYQPIQVSGVYVGGGFHSLAETGVYHHHIDYPLGRVVFDEPIPPSSVVTCEYSYRGCQWYTADSPWWQSIQEDSLRVDDPRFLQQGSGVWDVLGQNRVQLPAVIVESVLRTNRYGLELGSSAQVVQQDVLFHILTEDRPSLKFLHDAITTQKDERVRSFDKNLLYAADAFPLDDGGSPKPSGLTYPGLVNAYGWRLLTIKKTRSDEQPRLGDVRYATVRATVELDYL